MIFNVIEEGYSIGNLHVITVNFSILTAFFFIIVDFKEDSILLKNHLTDEYSWKNVKKFLRIIKHISSGF